MRSAPSGIGEHLPSRDTGRVGVLLLSMGEPESPAQVRPFLRELLADPDLVRLPVPPLQPLFAWAVSGLRGGRLRRRLAELGGGSPLVRLTGLQAAALQASLGDAGYFRVYAAMRYGPPRAREAARRMRADRVARAVALPLYPQYCGATTGSSLKDLRDSLREEGAAFPVLEVRSWPEHPGYVAALADLVARTLDRAPGRRAHLLFSAHAVPLSYIASGDPYQSEVERTVAAVRRVFPDLPHSLSYQGRAGRGRWLGPDTAAATVRLGRAGVKALVVVPVSFVSDHSETLHELDIVLRRIAQEAGIRTFLRVPALNDSPAFIAALKDLVLSAEAAS